MNTRLNIEKLDGNIVQKLGGSSRDREAEVFQVSNDDTTVAQRRLEDKQPKEKTNIDCLVKEQERNTRLGGRSRRNGLVKETNVTLLAKVKCIFLGYRKSIVGNKLWRLDDVTSKVVLYRNMGFNESGEYKKTFISYGVGTGSMHVLQRVEFEVEPQEEHTFEVEPHGIFDHVVGSQEVKNQDLIYYQLARDREQHLACERFRYREESNEATFVVAAVEKIYAHESLTFNNIVACEVVFKWKAGLKDDMVDRSDVYVLSNGCRKCSDDSDSYSWEYTPANGNVLGIEIVGDQSDNTLRVSQPSFTTKSWKPRVSDGLHERLDIASADVGMSDKFDRILLTDVHVFVDFDYAMGRSITVMESRYELRLVAGIATGALVKGDSRSEVPTQVEVAAYRY
nr:zinc finger, CCHC-type [Tanacetum cinerariifolium]